MNSFFKKWPYLSIAFIVITISYLNYIPGTYLTGWDNLHPELNLLLNNKRSLFSVWQEYQGLGLIGGLAYGSDLLRQIVLGVFSLFFPISFLRYLYTFSMLLLGGLGMLALLQKIFRENHEKNVISFVGALFYILNFGTVQTFYNSFEAFTAHFGFLPILILVFLNVLNKWDRKHFLIFLLLNIISISQAYVPTVFVVYLSILFFVFLGQLAKNKFKENFSKVLILFFSIFIINSFWLLPFIYFTKTHSQITVNSYMNQMSTEDIFMRNQKFGNLLDLARLRSFSFDYVDPDVNGKFDYLMKGWRSYLDNPFINVINYSLFAVILYGLYSGFRRKDKYYRSFLLLFIFAFTMLATDLIPFSWIVGLLRMVVPLFAQVFRVSFTKFGVLASFSYSIFFALGVMGIMSKFKERNNLKLEKLFPIIMMIFILAVSLPVFSGYLIYYRTRNNIPGEYFQLQNFFRDKSGNSRIGILPQYTYWGWGYYSWGYVGSGFLWYGLPQPTMDSAFDGYSSYNENYYWEISQAIYTSDRRRLEDILEKYQINWLVFDGNIINSSSLKSLGVDNIEDMLTASSKIKLVSIFGKIKVYKVNLVTTSKNYVFLADNLPVIGPKYEWNNYDSGYGEYGNYITENKEPRTKNSSDIYYPFRSLFTGRQQSELEFGVEDRGDYFLFSAQIPKNMVGGKLELPEIDKDSVTEISRTDLSKTTVKYPSVFLDGALVRTEISSSSASINLPYITSGKLEVVVPRIKGFYSYTSSPDDLFNQPVKNCDLFNNGVMKHDKTKIGNEDVLKLTSIGSSNCLDFDFPYLTQRVGYLVTVKSKWEEGKSLLFSVINKNSQRADLETYLPKASKTQSFKDTNKLTTSYFIIPPMEYYGEGYTLHLDNISIGRVKTVNELGKITLNPIPYDFLTAIKIVKNQESRIKNQGSLNITQVDHPNPSYYQITVSNETMKQLDNGTMILSQSYDEGWHAYEITNDWLVDSWYMKLLIPLFGKEMKDHVLVNNWENGWLLEDAKLQSFKDTKNQNSTIAIVYLPQYLEYLGFVLFGGFIIFLILYKPKPTKTETIFHNGEKLLQ
ncbi:MAG: hypothetical protein UT63_C0076G0004 [Candidatus Gottesmanbacteria bacterium GW2011_GWC2_39_8]|uniref:Membrane protein 6-pyruvoyl-tetrahydropterin synthase-related domain-containing protein n=1 Tax=Candidatus Gottesmanbacteria bacterium GW2011_GWC2_39_8 TaxID=1618450 RepID=A0A0G0PTQ8_9BACT|nr:MAG: hypothetical protein UT63_C0076G0004 [Candidatus Gottesmanbacteria bacterium GW2011_GWC2_39_8]